MGMVGRIMCFQVLRVGDRRGSMAARRRQRAEQRVTSTGGTQCLV